MFCIRRVVTGVSLYQAVAPSALSYLSIRVNIFSLLSQFIYLFSSSYICVCHPSQRLRWGFVTPFWICSSIWSLNLRRATRTSLTFFSTISVQEKCSYVCYTDGNKNDLHFKRGASSNKAVSLMSSNQLLMKIPLSG